MNKLKPLPLSARLNIKCRDSISTPTQTLRLPYAGSKALLNIATLWITSQQRSYVCKGKWGQALVEYCRQRYGWDQDTFDAVCWKVIKTVRSHCCTTTQQRQTSKIMHGWLPVGHMHGHATGNTQCPGCPCPDETMDHLFRCQHVKLNEKKDDLITSVRTKGISGGIPRVIMAAICQLLYDLIHGNTSAIPDHPSFLAKKAVRSQMAIGIRLFPRGFISIDNRNRKCQNC